MEIKCKERELPVWQDSLREKRSGLTLESVVPDTQGDVARIVWTQGGVLLKGKELGAGSLGINGEAWALVLYQNEEGKLESLRLSGGFRMDCELAQADEEALPQLRLRLERAEARALNPRKLSVNLSVCAAVRSFQRESLCLESSLGETPPGLCLQWEQRQALALSRVLEKPFSLRDQLPFPTNRPGPARLLGHELRFGRLSLEQIGSRGVLKGEAALELWGQDAEGLPGRWSFTLPFSQLLETGEEEYALRDLVIQPSAVYLDLTPGAEGESALDAEIQAVCQLSLWTKQELRALTDAYSVSCPLETAGEERSCTREISRGSAVLRAEENLPLPEDCADLLSALPSFGQLRREGESLRLDLGLDLLCRKGDGSLDAVHRRMSLTGTAPAESCLGELRCAAPELSREGETLRVRAAAEQDWELRDTESLRCLTALSLDEEHPFPASPAVYLVRRGDESLWDLGKRYRADPAAIQAANPQGGELLLIPR